MYGMDMPKRRSKLRLWCGRHYYCIKRKMFWIFGHVKFARVQSEKKYHYFQRELFGAYSRDNELRRKIYDLQGVEIGDEYITENHALMMYAPFLEER